MKKSRFIYFQAVMIAFLFFFLAAPGLCNQVKQNRLSKLSPSFRAGDKEKTPFPAHGFRMVSAPAKPARVVNSEDSEFIKEIADFLHTAIHGNTKNLETPASCGAELRKSVDAKARNKNMEAVRVVMGKNTGTPRMISGDLFASASSRTRMGAQETASAFLEKFKGLLQLQNPEKELRQIMNHLDDLEKRHLRYEQWYQGKRVWPSHLNLHLDALGNVELVNGAWIPTPAKIPSRWVISEKSAEQAALAAVPLADPANIRETEPVIYAQNARPPRPAYRFAIHLGLDALWTVVVDGMTGKVLFAENQVPTQAATGSGVDMRGNTRNFGVWEKDNRYYMVDTTKPMFSGEDELLPNPGFSDGTITILDARNQPETSDVEEIPDVYYVASDTLGSGWLRDAVSAAWSVSMTYDYFYERHNRDSVDGKGSSIFAVVRLGKNYDNAFWNTETRMVYFGDASPFAGSVGIVAHEITHGITSYTANLIYYGQPGALNEAYSDIFGEMAEARATGNLDWKIGVFASEPFRDLRDPGTIEIQPGLPYPSKMSEYIYTAEDNGGVHLNMTIPSHVFYLLAEGLSGAIGIEKAESIFFRALLYHLVANSDFVDARLACVKSAEELFGIDSPEVLKTKEAFNAAEIGEEGGTSGEFETQDPVTGEDASLFVYFDLFSFGNVLGRREPGDPESGIMLSRGRVAPARPSVVRNGSFAVFVNDAYDLCLIPTNNTEKEQCIGDPGRVNSAAVSPDGTYYGFVFQDRTGEVRNSISIYNMDTETTVSYQLVAPVFDEGISSNTIIQADAMSFTSDNRYIIYDALNSITFEDGHKLGAWSIYAIDLTTGQTLVLMPPVEGYDIGFPMISQTNDSYITFDALDTETGVSTIYTLNFITGDLVEVGLVDGNWATPCYTGDDSAIVYSHPDAYTLTGFSLYWQPLAEDRMTPLGTPGLYLKNADYPVVYRRGTWKSPDEGDNGEGNTNGDNGEDPEDPDNGQTDLTDSDGSSGGCFIRTTMRGRGR